MFQCSHHGEKDFLELGGSSYLSSSRLGTREAMCGFQPQPLIKVIYEWTNYSQAKWMLAPEWWCAWKGFQAQFWYFSHQAMVILCDSSTVRLVSSGDYKNSVTVLVRAADEDDLKNKNDVQMVCPDFWNVATIRIVLPVENMETLLIKETVDDMKWLTCIVLVSFKWNKSFVIT